MGQRLTLAVQGKMDVAKINGYDDDDDDDDDICNSKYYRSIDVIMLHNTFELYEYEVVVGTTISNWYIDDKITYLLVCLSLG
jgi:hypothetical protein